MSRQTPAKTRTGTKVLPSASTDDEFPSPALFEAWLRVPPVAFSRPDPILGSCD